MKFVYHRSASSLHVSRLLPALILASLLFTLLPALSPPLTGAQDGEAPATTEVLESGEPTPVPEVQDSMEPTPTPENPEGEPAEADPEGQSGASASYVAEARACPPGFDLAAGDVAAALAGCAEPIAGVAFTLGSQNPVYPGDTRTSGGDGLAVWSDIPLGTGYSITATAPQGSSNPWIYCEVTGGPGADQYLYLPSTGGMDIGLSDPNLAQYTQSYCRWFTVPTAEAGLEVTPEQSDALGAGEVHLSNYRCPVNYNTADMTLPALQMACTTPGDTFQFTLKASSGNARAGVTDAQGTLLWTGVPSGKLTIAETIPAGYQFAQPYCSVAPVGSGPGTPDLSLVQSDGKTINGTLLAGQALHCSLFNIPSPESTVAVIPFLCPPDYDTADMTLQALTVGCSIPGLNIEYTLTTADGAQSTGSTGSNGFLEWKQIPSGTVAIAQEAPPGYLAGPAYCDPAPPQGELDGTSWQLPTQENGIVSYDIPARHTLNCFFFYVEGIAPTVLPAGTGSGSVVVHGYVCASELYELAGDVQHYLDACQTPNDGASVRLYSAESGADQTGAFTGGAPLSFPDVPPGETELNLLSSSSQFRLFCAAYPRGEASPPISAYAEVPVTVDIEGGNETSCYWFSFQQLPDDAYVTITIDKKRCGAEFPDSIVIDDWRAVCPNPHPGVTFDVTHASGMVVTGTTGDDGLVNVRVLPGDVYIQATAPDSNASGYAWCGAGAAGTEPAYVNAGRINAGESAMPLSDIDSSLVYSCDWITVPLEETPKMTDEGGSVVVLKWRCPDGYDASGVALDQLRIDCQTPQPGVQISVSYASGESFTGLTRLEKGPAVARFEGQPAGDVSIGELGPSNHELQRVICSTSDAGQTGFGVIIGYMEYPVADGGITATIEAGKELSCQFFNVPAASQDAPPKAGMVYVDSRTCPPGFATINSSYVDIAMYCSSEAGVEFKITQGETELAAITNESGLARFTDVPTGAFRIATYPREGYDQPRVFCRFTLEGEGSTGSLDPVTVDNWGVPSDLKTGYFMECVWANMPAAPTSADPGKVILQQHVCPEATDVHASLETLLDKCALGPAGVQFTAGQPLTTPQDGTTDSSAGVAFSNIAPGFNQVNEVSGQGYKPIAAWCGYVSPSGVTQVSRYTAEPLNLYLAGGHSVECSWFSVPYVEPAQVEIVTRSCPADIALVDLTNDRILAECLEMPADVPFRVQQGSALGAESTPGAVDTTSATGVEGTVSFEEIPPMPLRISEFSVAYQTVHVNCGSARIGESPTSYTSLSLTAEGIDYAAEPNTVITCYWATVEVPPSTIELTKLVCSTDYDFAEASHDDVIDDCETLPDFEFSLSAGDGAYLESQRTNSLGIARFEGVPPGTILMSESSSEYHAIGVFCGALGLLDEIDYVDLELRDRTAEYTVEGSIYKCVWVNIETTHARTTVHAVACQEGHAPQGHSYQEVLEECRTPLQGASYTLGGPATELSADTDSSGTVAWEDIAPGPLFISKTPPGGYSSAFVFCATLPIGSDFAQAPFERVPVDQLSIEGEVDAGEALVCYWFNYSEPSTPDQPLPTPTATPAPGNPIVQPGTPTPATDAPATLIITKYTCAAGYDLHVAEADPATDCDELAAGIEFTLAALDKHSAPLADTVATTDDDGVVVFTDLAPGLWLLTETLPENTLAAFVSTCESDLRDFSLDNPFNPFAYAGPEGQIGVTLIPGETLECNAYDIPQGAVTLLAYQCPSAADTITGCEPATDPLAVRFTSVDGGETVTLMTDELGAASAELPSGIYALTDLPETICLIESEAFDADDQLVVAYGQPIEVRISTCSSGS